MDDRPDFIVRRAFASAVRTARHVSAAIALGALSLGLGAGSVAHAGVPLPVVAETTGMLTLATVVKRIAPSVVTIEGRGREQVGSENKGPVAGLVGIEDGVVSGVANLESPGVEVPGWRPRHEKRYQQA
jgi:hypothetical protein